ncbi:MAG: LVIVD repeat-containing protein [Gemmatimonas sp.]
MHFLPTPRRSAASIVRHGALAGALFSISACATTRTATPPAPATNPALDARVGLKAGLTDAEQAVSNMKILSSTMSPQGFAGITNSDLAFTGKYAIQGNYNGPVIWDMTNPAKPQLVTAYTCPASQNDISVYKNLMFMSAEAQNGRIDCKPGGAPDAKDKMRGVRVFDISDIKNPKLIANVQTCRGSHTHTVLEDPKDKQNIYIYVSGSSGIRSADELPGCDANLSPEQQAASKLRVEIIKVPLNDPSKAAVVNRANIFSGLKANPAHGLSEADIEAARKAASTDQAKTALATAKTRGAFVANHPQSGVEMVVNPNWTRTWLDSIVKLRKGTGAPTAADTATLRANVQTWMNNQFALAANPHQHTAVNEGSQCHDITVYPSLGLAGGACEGHGLLLDISDPVNPVRLDAVADSNFSYWHSATFNNDGTKLLFSDEWGGGGGPKCRPGDKPEWGADAIFTIENKKLKFQSYYKIPTYQTSNENCVAHNGSLIPIPDRDVMIQAWYQGGISVFDWSDAKRPIEIASFDRGPIDSTKMVSGGSWSAYWYNGNIISSEIARGLDVAELVPSPFLTRNEIDAAKTVKWDYLNAQGQPQISWPPSFALAKAYTDQLDRKGCVGVKKIGSIRAAIDEAEKTTGAARSAALSKLTKEVDDAKSCDARKVDLLKKTIQGLSTVVM